MLSSKNSSWTPENWSIYIYRLHTTAFMDRPDVSNLTRKCQMYGLGVDKFNKAEPTVCSSTYKKSDILLSWRNIGSKSSQLYLNWEGVIWYILKSLCLSRNIKNTHQANLQVMHIVRTGWTQYKATSCCHHYVSMIKISGICSRLRTTLLLFSTISSSISLSFLSLISLCLLILSPSWPSQRRKMWTNCIGWWNMCPHSHGITQFWSASVCSTQLQEIVVDGKEIKKTKSKKTKESRISKHLWSVTTSSFWFHDIILSLLVFWFLNFISHSSYSL